jgi:hypothetical protein
MAVVHNVLFKLRDPADVERTAEILRGMDGKIDVLRALEVGVDRLGTPRSYHIALVTRFDSWEDLETYRTHPVHAPVLEHMGRVAEHAAVVDYEV